MKKHFYSHLVDLNEISNHLSQLHINIEEKNELLHLVYENIHHAVIELVLDIIDDKDKDIFLFHLENKNHNEVFLILSKKRDNPENVILDVIQKTQKEAIEDITEVLEL